MKDAAKTDLRAYYRQTVLPKLQKDLKKKNCMAVPKIEKVKINVGIGSIMTKGNKDYDDVLTNVTAIAGQKPVITKAKKAISNFKTRKGLPVGITVTLRGERMYDFINKLVNIVLPRVRDFRGISKKSFDGQGNYSIGFKEHTVFPEINPDDIIKVHGIQVTICTTGKSTHETMSLLKEFRFPFQK